MSFVNNLGSPLFSGDTHPEEVYRVDLILNGDSEDTKSSNLIEKHSETSCLKSSLSPLSSFPFTCEARFNSPGIQMQISDVFKIQPVFDPTSGSYASLTKLIFLYLIHLVALIELLPLLQVDMPASCALSVDPLR